MTDNTSGGTAVGPGANKRGFLIIGTSSSRKTREFVAMPNRDNRAKTIAAATGYPKPSEAQQPNKTHKAVSTCRNLRQQRTLAGGPPP
jgi:hypothetical protein